MRSLLIRDTTREEREEIVRRALSACGGSCDGCNGCGLFRPSCAAPLPSASPWPLSRRS